MIVYIQDERGGGYWLGQDGEHYGCLYAANEAFARIQKKAKDTYQQSKGTPTEEIASIVNQEVQKWQIGNQKQMTRDVDHLVKILKVKLPGNQEIEDIRNEKIIEKQYELILMFIAMIQQGDIFNVIGNGNIVGKHIVAIKINQQQLMKIPDEYAKSLEAFSQEVNSQLKKYNISEEKIAPVQKSINELIKEVEGFKPEEKIDIEKKEDIKGKITKVAIKLLKILPEGAETVATFTPLAPFSKIIGKGVKEIVEKLQSQM